MIIHIFFTLTGKKNPIRAPVTFPTKVIAPITPELNPAINQVIILTLRMFKYLFYSDSLLTFYL